MKRAIYTYCNQRFNEPGGGWGFYSYSDGLNLIFQNDEQFEKVLGSSSFKPPSNDRVWLKLPFADTPETYRAEKESIEKYHEAFEEHNTYASTMFLEHMLKFFKFKVECVQTDNGCEFTKKFVSKKKNNLFVCVFEVHLCVVDGFRHTTQKYV